MSEIVKVDIQINTKNLERKLRNICTDSTVRLQIHNLLAKMCDPFVPFLEGPLSETIEVTPNFVRYTQPYAHYQYHGTHFNHTIDYHPLASAEWDKAMLRVNGDSFRKQVEDLIRNRSRQLYG